MKTVEALLVQLPDRVSAIVPGLDLPVTASAGVASVAADMNVSAALKAADVRLYAAKAAGRNQLVGSGAAENRPRVA